MNMKDLKMYVAPASEVVELETKSVLLAGSGSDNVHTEIPTEEPEE